MILRLEDGGSEEERRTFVPGALCRMRSGGPVMTVYRSEWTDPNDLAVATLVYVVYADRQGVIRYEQVHPRLLVLWLGGPEAAAEQWCFR